MLYNQGINGDPENGTGREGAPGTLPLEQLPVETTIPGVDLSIPITAREAFHGAIRTVYRITAEQGVTVLAAAKLYRPTEDAVAASSLPEGPGVRIALIDTAADAATAPALASNVLRALEARSGTAITKRRYWPARYRQSGEETEEIRTQ